MDEITENELNPLINNQNKTIIYIKVKQVFDKLRNDLRNDLSFLKKVDFRNKQSNDLNDINKINKL